MYYRSRPNIPWLVYITSFVDKIPTVIVRPLGSSWNKGRTQYCASELCLWLFFLPYSHHTLLKQHADWINTGLSDASVYRSDSFKISVKKYNPAKPYNSNYFQAPFIFDSRLIIISSSYHPSHTCLKRSSRLRHLNYLLSKQGLAGAQKGHFPFGQNFRE